MRWHTAWPEVAERHAQPPPMGMQVSVGLSLHNRAQVPLLTQACPLGQERVVQVPSPLASQTSQPLSQAVVQQTPVAQKPERHPSPVSQKSPGSPWARH